jgi:hypothetical protein
MEEKEFSNQTHCTVCRRYIDEENVKLKKLIIGPENSDKFEKICSDCFRKGDRSV